MIQSLQTNLIDTEKDLIEKMKNKTYFFLFTIFRCPTANSGYKVIVPTRKTESDYEQSISIKYYRPCCFRNQKKIPACVKRFIHILFAWTTHHFNVNFRRYTDIDKLNQIYSPIHSNPTTSHINIGQSAKWFMRTICI